MNIENFNKYLVSADNFCDNVPLLSTVTNLANLFQKYFVFPFLDQSTIYNSKYYSHLKNKSDFECMMLLIPVFNFAYLHISMLPRRRFLEECKRGVGFIQLSVSDIRCDRRCVLAAIQQNRGNDCVNNGSDALKRASPSLQKDPELIRIAKEIDEAARPPEAEREAN